MIRSSQRDQVSGMIRSPACSLGAVQRIVICLMVVALAGCGKSLSRSKAASLLTAHEAFRKPLTVRYLDAKGIFPSPDHSGDQPVRTCVDRTRSATIAALRKVGVVKVAPIWSNCGNDETPVEVQLTEQGKAVVSKWEKKPAVDRANALTLDAVSLSALSGASIFSIPIATRELVEITGVSQAQNKADVEFKWRWKPNDIGQAYGAEFTDQKSRAHMTLYDDGWRLDNEGVPPDIALQQEPPAPLASLKVDALASLKFAFATGHGEHDTGGSGRTGYAKVRDALGRYGSIDGLNSLASERLRGFNVVIVAGPTKDFEPEEVKAVNAFVGSGGSVLFLMDPPAMVGPPLTNLEALLREWGVEAGKNVVVDVSGMGQLLGTDASVPIAANYPSHPITRQFGLITAYPLARSVTSLASGVDGRMAQTFIETGPRSWAETNIKELMTTGKVSLEEKTGDKKGPVSLAVAVDGKASSTGRLVVVGDSDFATNATIGIQGNVELFLAIVKWLSRS